MNPYIESCEWESLKGFNDDLAEMYARESALILGFDVIETDDIATEGIKDFAKEVVNGTREKAGKEVELFRERASKLAEKMKEAVDNREIW